MPHICNLKGRMVCFSSKFQVLSFIPWLARSKVDTKCWKGVMGKDHGNQKAECVGKIQKGLSIDIVPMFLPPTMTHFLLVGPSSTNPFSYKLIQLSNPLKKLVPSHHIRSLHESLNAVTLTLTGTVMHYQIETDS